MIDLFDLVRTVWRHRLVALATLLAVMAATSAFVATQKPVYQSTETLQLSSRDPAFLGEVNALTPLYSELLSAQQTLAMAGATLGSTPLASIAVRIFTDSPVIKLDASGGSADIVQRSAAAVVNALSDRLSLPSQLGAPGVTLAVIDGPSRADMVWPRTALSLGVAAVVGILLGVATSWLADARRRIPAVALAIQEMPHRTAQPAQSATSPNAANFGHATSVQPVRDRLSPEHIPPLGPARRRVGRK
jgi:capsular polysaccharide biosynthesis protein